MMKRVGRRGLGVGLVLTLMVLVSAGTVLAADDGQQAVTDMKTLMNTVIQPASDAVFYVSRNPPATEAQWLEMERQTLVLAESANLLLVPGYAAGTAEWVRYTAAMRDVSVRAWQAAQDRDVEALMELNNDLYVSCQSCHDATR